jgi:hypothetical protein
MFGRTDPPAGFSARTVERIVSADARRLRTAHSRRSRTALLALAASLVLTVAGSSYFVQRHVRREAERVSRDVEIALEVVEHTLNDVRTRVANAVQHAGAHHAQPSP